MTQLPAFDGTIAGSGPGRATQSTGTSRNTADPMPNPRTGMVRRLSLTNCENSEDYTTTVSMMSHLGPSKAATRVVNSYKSEKDRLHSITRIRVMNITDGEAARVSNSSQEINKIEYSKTAPGSLTARHPAQPPF
jgi:hypothetical protein